MIRLFVVALFLLLPHSLLADLPAYLKKPSDYKWAPVSTAQVNECRIQLLRLTSQVWQGITWEHDLLVIVPPEAQPGQPVFITNTGGSANPKHYPMLSLIARQVKVPCAFLFQIPNQPLFDGKKEDALIAETFVRYLETGDESWPLLFPMVRSVVRAMDALQEWGAENLGAKPGKFILTGASKRGWTTWLTAASDPRLVAIVPMVIDVLNTPAQMKHQTECYGAPSEQIVDYTNRGLIPSPDTERARRLWAMTDPWSFRSQYTMPKLIVLGTNDPYWTVDALNIYWDDLPAAKWISYTPNAGHDLKETGGRPMRALNASAAFVRHIVSGQPMPDIAWKHTTAENGSAVLTVTAHPAPRQARVWKTTAPGSDFRPSKWLSEPIDTVGPLTAKQDAPATGSAAFYVELQYLIDDIEYNLCTQMRVLKAPR